MKEENQEIEGKVAILIAKLGPRSESCPTMTELLEIEKALEAFEAFVKRL